MREAHGADSSVDGQPGPARPRPRSATRGKRTVTWVPTPWRAADRDACPRAPRPAAWWWPAPARGPAAPRASGARKNGWNSGACDCLAHPRRRCRSPRAPPRAFSRPRRTATCASGRPAVYFTALESRFCAIDCSSCAGQSTCTCRLELALQLHALRRGRPGPPRAGWWSPRCPARAAVRSLRLARAAEAQQRLDQLGHPRGAGLRLGEHLLHLRVRHRLGAPDQRQVALERGSGATRSCATRQANASSSWLRRSSSASCSWMVCSCRRSTRTSRCRRPPRAPPPQRHHAPTRCSWSAGSPAGGEVRGSPARSCGPARRPARSSCSAMRTELGLEVLSRALRLLAVGVTQGDLRGLGQRLRGLVEPLPQLLLTFGQPLRVREPGFLRIGEGLLHPRVGRCRASSSVARMWSSTAFSSTAASTRIRAISASRSSAAPNSSSMPRVGPQLVPEREGRHRCQQRDDEEERRPVAAKRQRSSHDGSGILSRPNVSPALVARRL